MNEPQVLQALLYLDDGQEALVEPKHNDKCRKGQNGKRWTGCCPGCKFDLLANELLSHYRLTVVDVNHREVISNEQG